MDNYIYFSIRFIPRMGINKGSGAEDRPESFAE
jgi:hypothetical protein